MNFNTILNDLRNYRYHKSHKKTALNALRNIEKDTNYKLSSRNKKMIKDYACEILGSSNYAYWLYVYTAYNQKFKEGWIPDNYFGEIVTPNINSGIGRIANIKTLTNKLIQSPLLPDKMYKINDIFYDKNFQSVGRKNIKDVLFSEDNKEYFLKLDHSNSGRGVSKITYENFDLEELQKLDNFVIQDAIKQHEFFNEIVTGSVATIRITTVKVKDNIETRAAYLRVGRKKSSFLQAESNLRVPIINKAGELGEFASDAEWKRFYKHPDTDYIFKGQIIPHFKKATNAMENIHKTFPHFTIIGWDVSVTETGQPQIIEWNAGHPDIKFTESTIGPSFKDLNWENLKE